MQNEIIVHILSYNCIDEGNNMAVTAKDDKLILDTYENGNKYQQWRLVPNLAATAREGGYTITNVTNGLSIFKVEDRQQIILKKIERPYGNGQFCWSFWQDSKRNDEIVWGIQTQTGGPVWDAAGMSCEKNTKIQLWEWTNNNNQRWFIRL